MGHLMKEGVRALLVHQVSHSGSKQQLLGNYHAANILDRTVELRHEDLVVLCERVVSLEQASEKVKSAFSDVEYVVGVKKLGEGRPTGQSERDDLTRDRGVSVMHYHVLSGHHRGEVGRDTWRRRKVPHRVALGEWLEFGGGLV